jgi:hypothetical protein
MLGPFTALAHRRRFRPGVYAGLGDDETIDLSDPFTGLLRVLRAIRWHTITYYGEWFALGASDIASFKRRKFM